MRTHPLPRALPLSLLVAALACRDAASTIVPQTALGTSASAWLFAHNRGDGHAMVHYTLGNRGTATINGAQMDSTVYDGVEFAKTVGHLTPTSLIESTDSALTLSLQSERGESWTARFTPAAQPSAVRVQVVVARAATR